MSLTQAETCPAQQDLLFLLTREICSNKVAR